MDQTSETSRNPQTEPLRLMVVDAEDLAVVSAHLQDAETSLADMAYLPAAHRFALVLARYDRAGAAAGRLDRCQAGLHFERVLKVARRDLPEQPAKPLQLLALSFVPVDPPSGDVLLTFAGGGLIRLTVECLEAGLQDLGSRWAASGCPDHPVLDEAPADR